jgi:hypothetical protein
MAVRPTFSPGDTLTATSMSALSNSLITVNAQTGTAYTPGTAQVGQLTTLDNAAAQSITIPDNATTAFAIGDQLNFMLLGTGTATFAAGGTAVIRSAGAKLKLTTQYAVCTVLKWDTDAWIMVGNVSA